MNRKQFTFHDTFWEAIDSLPESEQLPVFRAVCRYALAGEMAEGLTGGALVTFLGEIFPDLKYGRTQAENGSKGGRPKKATESDEKPKKATESEKKPKKANESDEKPKKAAFPREREEEEKKKSPPTPPSKRKEEVEKENIYPPIVPPGGPRADENREADFEKFWAEYPTKVGKQSAKKAFGKVKVPLETLLTALRRQKCSSQWSKENGRYIPNPATWLNQGRWEDELPGSTAVTNTAGVIVAGTSTVATSDELERLRRALAELEGGDGEGG